MAQFLLLLHESPAVLEGMSPEEMQRVIQRYRKWTEDLRASGRLVHSSKLTEEGGRRLRRRGEEVEVTDGPYSEAKEVVGGFYVVEGADYAAAVELAGGCPHVDYGWIEVRQVDVMPAAAAG
jgi:hypothetical protein